MTPLPYARLSAFYFAYLAGLGAFSPYFPLWLDARGLDAAAISVVMALWYGTRVVSPIAWGTVVQRSADPARWLRIGCIATALGFAGFLLPLPYAGVIAVMAVFSFFYNAVLPQFDALTLSHLEGRAARYGRIRVWGSIGFVAMVAGLGPLFERIGVRWLPAVMLAIFLVMIAVARGARYGAAAPRRDDGESLLRSLGRPGVPRFIAQALLMQVAHGPYYVFFSLFLAEHGYGPSWVGTFWAIGVLAEIAMFWFAPGWLRRAGTAPLLWGCLLMAALRFSGTALLPENLVALVLLQLLHAFTFGLFHAACMQRVTELFPGHLLAQGQGLLYGIGSGVGGVLGALLAGWAWTGGGGERAFALAALAAFLALLMVPKPRSRAD